MTSPKSSGVIIGVAGLWHLGCTIAACWTKIGYQVRAFDCDEKIVLDLKNGRPPLYEPGLKEQIDEAVSRGYLSFSTDPTYLKGCHFVFVAYDIPVRKDDTCDLSIIKETLSKIKTHLDKKTIVIVSSQLPAGTSRQLRAELKAVEPTLDLVYSPENLRLGQSIACYLTPGHIVIGADDKGAANRTEELFAPMKAKCIHMNLASAEITKHAINSYLATSITLANQWADLCAVVGADVADVVMAVKQDPRIGEKAYLSAGIGFSGGTLGRDLRILDHLSQEKADGSSPIFGEIWRYNKARLGIVSKQCGQILGSLKNKTIALLGMTYKPGTSTLRRSLPLKIASDLAKQGASIKAYDPKADWSEAPLPQRLTICSSAYDALQAADMGVLLTEWPDFLSLNFHQIKEKMKRAVLFDTKDLLRARHQELKNMGFRILSIGRACQETT